jgi:hypothetical protein
MLFTCSQPQRNPNTHFFLEIAPITVLGIQERSAQVLSTEGLSPIWAYWKDWYSHEVQAQQESHRQY